MATCSYDDIASCPSARILKVLLTRIGKALQPNNEPSNSNESETLRNRNIQIQINQILDVMISKHQYSATKLLDDLHHLKSKHEIDNDDAQYDVAYDFFKSCTADKRCDVNQCPLIERQYRDRGLPVLYGNAASDETDDVLMDTVAMIHCYLLHSFDINRLTKEERDRVEESMNFGVSLDDEQKENENAEIDYMERLQLIAPILAAKQERLNVNRRIGRFHEEENYATAPGQVIDFGAMAKSVGVDEVMLKEELSQYGHDQHKFVTYLIDVIYGEDVEVLLCLKIISFCIVFEHESSVINHRKSSFNPVSTIIPINT